MIKKTNQKTNKQKKKNKKKDKKKDQNKKKKQKTQACSTDLRLTTIFHPNDPLFQNGCGWNGKLHSLSTRPVAMIYFRMVWSPKKWTFWTKKLFEPILLLGP